MNETTKDVLIHELEQSVSLIEVLPDDSALLKEISEVTDTGNLRTIFLNMKFFLETGALPRSLQGYSSLPAVVFNLPTLQAFLVKEFAGRVSLGDIGEMSALYLRKYKELS